MYFLHSLDNSILHFFSITIKNSLFDFIMPIISTVNNNGEIWIAIAVILMLNRKKEIKKMGFTLLIALIMGYILGEVVLKNIVGRQRPVFGVEGYKFLVSIPKSYSFPSGHTTSSFAAAGVIWLSRAKYRVWALVLAVLIAFSRLYLHVHYPSDVLGGIILGLACAYASIWGVSYISNRRKKEKNNGGECI